MKSSFEMFSCFQSSLYRGETESTNSLLLIPFAAAVFSTFWPCSSVPVRKKTSRPVSLMYRAIASAATVVYACPMWGMSFT